jgi:hypothetical protein
MVRIGFFDSWESGGTGQSGAVKTNHERQERVRKALLRVALGALGMAAVFGAAGVLFAGHDTVWRVVGSCVVTGAGALILLGFSRLLESRAESAAGPLGIGLTVIEYLASMGLIWDSFGRNCEKVGISMVALAATGLPFIGLLEARRKREASVSANVGLVLCAADFALFVSGIWAGGPNGSQGLGEHLALTGASLAVLGALALIALVGAGVDRRHWRWGGVVAAVAAFLMSIHEIWFEKHDPSTLFICLLTVAAVVAHANVLLWLPMPAAQLWLVAGTIAAGAATGALVDAAKIIEPVQEELLGRLSGATAIVAGCGTLAIMVLARMQRHSTAARTIPVDALREIALVCPRCRAKVTVPIGEGRCDKCGLVVAVQLRESV